MGTTPHAARDGHASGRRTVRLDITSLRAELEKLETRQDGPIDLFDEELALFLEYWPKRNHEDVAKLFGLNPSTALRIYRRHTQVRSRAELELEALR